MPEPTPLSLSVEMPVSDHVNSASNDDRGANGNGGRSSFSSSGDKSRSNSTASRSNSRSNSTFSRSSSTSAFDSSSVSPPSTPPTNLTRLSMSARMLASSLVLSATSLGKSSSLSPSTFSDDLNSSDYTNQKQWPFLNEGEIAHCTGPMLRRSGFVSRKRVVIITNQRLIVANPRSKEVKYSVDWTDDKFEAVAKNSKVLVLTMATGKCTLVVANGEAQKWVNLIRAHKSGGSSSGSNSSRNSISNSSDSFTNETTTTLSASSEITPTARMYAIQE